MLLSSNNEHLSLKDKVSHFKQEKKNRKNQETCPLDTSAPTSLATQIYILMCLMKSIGNIQTRFYKPYLYLPEQGFYVNVTFDLMT